MVNFVSLALHDKMIVIRDNFESYKGQTRHCQFFGIFCSISRGLRKFASDVKTTHKRHHHSRETILSDISLLEVGVLENFSHSPDEEGN